MGWWRLKTEYWRLKIEDNIQYSIFNIQWALLHATQCMEYYLHWAHAFNVSTERWHSIANMMVSEAVESGTYRIKHAGTFILSYLAIYWCVCRNMCYRENTNIKKNQVFCKMSVSLLLLYFMALFFYFLFWYLWLYLFLVRSALSVPDTS